MAERKKDLETSNAVFVQLLVNFVLSCVKKKKKIEKEEKKRKRKKRKEKTTNAFLNNCLIS